MDLLHILLSFFLIFCSFFVLFAENPVHSVLFLILCFFSVSCILFLFHVEFLALLIHIIYVGAIAVLFLLVVMMLNVKKYSFTYFTNLKFRNFFILTTVNEILNFFLNLRILVLMYYLLNFYFFDDSYNSSPTIVGEFILVYQVDYFSEAIKFLYFFVKKHQVLAVGCIGSTISCAYLKGKLDECRRNEENLKLEYKKSLDKSKKISNEINNLKDLETSSLYCDKKIDGNVFSGDFSIKTFRPKPRSWSNWWTGKP